MELLIEFIGELLFELFFELGSNSKVPKWIRYPMIGIIGLFCLFIILLIYYFAILFWEENIWISLLFIFFASILLLSFIFGFKKKFLFKGNKE